MADQGNRRLSTVGEVARYGRTMANLGSIAGDPDEITVTTTDPDRITVRLSLAGATDLTREAAEELAGLLMRAVREPGG